MKRKLLIVFTFLFALVLGFGVLTACGGGSGGGSSEEHGVSINISEATIGVGVSRTLTATSKSKTQITWTTSDASVVEITSQTRGVAKVLALKSGVATLTATDEEGESANCVITVEEYTVTIEGAEDGKVTLYRNEDGTYESKTLTAKVYRSGVETNESVIWSSSDESVITVDKGVLTAYAIKEGITITAQYVNGNAEATVTADVKWKTMPAGWYQFPASEEGAGLGEGGAIANPGQWSWSADGGWGGSNPVVVGEGWDAKGSASINVTGNTGWRWYGVQLFYKNPDLTAGQVYQLKFKLSSSAEGYITVNGTEVKVNEGDNDITVWYREAGGESASVNINLAAHDMLRDNVNPATDENGNNKQYTAGTLNISNAVWTEYTPEQLAAPTAFTIAAGDKEVTVTETNDVAKMEGYLFGFFEEGKQEPTYTQPIMKPVEGRDILENRGGITLLPDADGKVADNAGKMYLDDSFLPEGTYTVKVKVYSGVAKYADSNWSEATQTYTKTGGADYKVLPSYRDVDRGIGRYYVWSEWGQYDLANCNFKNNTLTLTLTGQADWYSNQVIYMDGKLVPGTEYQMKFTFNGKDSEGNELDLTGQQFVINGARIDPTKGATEFTVPFTYEGGTAVTMLLGQPNDNFSATVTDGGLPAGVYTFSNVTFTNMDEIRGEKDGDAMYFGDNSAETPLEDDKLMYWFATRGDWTNPNTETDKEWRALGVDLNDWGYAADTTSATGKSYWFQYKVNPIEGKYCSWISRFWYRNSANTSGAEYKLEITIDSDEEGDAFINGTPVHIEKGEHTYTVYYTEGQIHVNDYDPPLNASLMIVLATENSMMGADADGIHITFKSLKWTEGGKQALADPAATLQEGTVTITSGSEGVDHFEIGLFDSETATSPVSTQTIVSGGKIEDAKHYNGQYTVKIRACGDADHKDSNWVTLGQYTVTGGSATRLGGESDSIANKDHWYIWADHWDWRGSQVTIISSSADETAKKFAIDYSTQGNPSLGYGLQLFYKNSANIDGTLYKLTFKIKSSAAGSVTINGTIIELVANEEKEVTVSYKEDGGKASFSLQAGIYEHPESAIMNSKIEISDWAWSQVTEKTLAAPTDFAIDASGKISFTDPNENGVKGYQLAFFKGNDMYQIFTVKNGDTLNTSTVFKGTYDVKVQAIGDNSEYLSSGWSNAVQKEVTADPSYALTDEGDLTPMYTFYYWREWNNGIDNAKFENGQLSFNMINGGNWYSHQITYRLNVTGHVKTFTVKLNSTIEGKKIVINGEVITLKAGDQTITINFEDDDADGKPTFELCMGEPKLPNWDDTVSFVDSGTFVFSDFLWTMADGTQYNLQGKVS